MEKFTLTRFFRRRNVLIRRETRQCSEFFTFQSRQIFKPSFEIFDELLSEYSHFIFHHKIIRDVCAVEEGFFSGLFYDTAYWWLSVGMHGLFLFRTFYVNAKTAAYCNIADCHHEWHKPMFFFKLKSDYNSKIVKQYGKHLVWNGS